MTTAIADRAADEREDEARSLASWVARFGGKTLVYALLILWTVIALFPIYWTLSTSLKLGRDVTQGHLIPWLISRRPGKAAIARAVARHHLRHL